MLHDLIAGWYGEPTYQIFASIFKYYYIWLPIISGIIFWEIWVRYVRYYFFFNTQTVLLEVRLPQEILKSPVAMELVLGGFWQLGGEFSFIDRYWSGKTRAWFSLELVSIGGEVHFYIWTRENMRDILESHIYSQYPEVEVRIVHDYARDYDYDPNVNFMWGCIQVLNEATHFPIKTYVDYGLEKDPKEEFKNDPITPVLELLGSIKKGEQIWVQYIIRAHKTEKRRGSLSKKTDWKADVLEARNKILKTIAGDAEVARRPTMGESEVLQAMERGVRKFPFDFACRSIYIAERKEVINKTMVTALRGLLKSFSVGGGFHKKDLGGFNGFHFEMGTDFDYPWQDFNNVRVNRKIRKMLDGYKRRMAFFSPYKFDTFVLNAEELATLFHFPGKNAATPGLIRIPSKRAQAPTNLPT